MSANRGARQAAKKTAKRQRRNKRRAVRIVNPLGPIDAELDELAEQIASAAKKFDAWITSRGWLLDADNATDEVVSWVYPPSAAQVAEDAESVSRVWIAIVGGDDDFPRTVKAAVVGTAADGVGYYSVSPDRLVDRIEALEAYRPGDPAPEIA